ncbi:DUF6292 family protein [Amycolatopsis aidingensis]|uniref:DUF6292 family protein n=1 Tax=Amycolatopsis aidingensis TaxID=2842453 RepID=UPI0038CC1591
MIVDADHGLEDVGELEYLVGFGHALQAYLDAVAAEFGIGRESCTVDLDVPVSAYLALDLRSARFPDRELALLWDERHGWAAAIETHSGEDLIVLDYLGGTEVCPEPGRVARFVTAVCAEGHTAHRVDPPRLRAPGRHRSLATALAGYREPPAAGV